MFIERAKDSIGPFIGEHPATIATVMINLFNSSREEIKIFCGSLNPEIYCNKGVIEALEKALNRGVGVYIITDYEKAEKRSKSDPYCDEFEILKWAKENRLQMFDYANQLHYLNNFIVVDKVGFMVEGFSRKSLSILPHTTVVAHSASRPANRFSEFFENLIVKGFAQRVNAQQFR